MPTREMSLCLKFGLILPVVPMWLASPLVSGMLVSSRLVLCIDYFGSAPFAFLSVAGVLSLGLGLL